MDSQIELSVIIPVGPRYDDVSHLLKAYQSGIEAMGLSYELIYVLDGSRADVSAELGSQQRDTKELRIIQLSRTFGEATALEAGFELSLGGLILTLPAYFQVEPAELRRLLEAKNNYQMVIARRWPRHGSRMENLRRSAFHGLLRWITGHSFKDLGCGVRLFDREVLEEISLYGDQHRFLPVTAERSGFRVLELDVKQSSHDRFRGGYSLREYLRRVLDMFTVFFLVRFTKKPLRFFGTVGSLIFLFGGACLSYIIVQRLFFDQPLADRPALLLSSLLIVLGLQIFGLGLLGELIIFTHARDIKEYRIERIVH